EQQHLQYSPGPARREDNIETQTVTPTPTPTPTTTTTTKSNRKRKQRTDEDLRRLLLEAVKVPVYEELSVFGPILGDRESMVDRIFCRVKHDWPASRTPLDAVDEATIHSLITIQITQFRSHFKEQIHTGLRESFPNIYTSRRARKAQSTEALIEVAKRKKLNYPTGDDNLKSFSRFCHPYCNINSGEYIVPDLPEYDEEEEEEEESDITKGFLFQSEIMEVAMRAAYFTQRKSNPKPAEVQPNMVAAVYVVVWTINADRNFSADFASSSGKYFKKVLA
ncbi:hypothetical protein HK096_000724, partial [Nowakowskiella sp. JEL0078]